MGARSFIFAGITVFIVKKMTAVESMLILWITGFLMMWIVAGNLNVLPFKLLIFAIPLSIIEVFVAVFISRKIITGR
jgi:hypothetical protein